MEEKPKFDKNEYSPYREAADVAELKVTDAYTQAAKLKVELADKKKDFEEMTKKNLDNTLLGQAGSYPAGELLEMEKEIKAIEAKIANLTRLAEAGSTYAHNLVKMDNKILDEFDKMDPKAKPN